MEELTGKLFEPLPGRGAARDTRLAGWLARDMRGARGKIIFRGGNQAKLLEQQVDAPDRLMVICGCVFDVLLIIRSGSGARALAREEVFSTVAESRGQMLKPHRAQC